MSGTARTEAQAVADVYKEAAITASATTAGRVDAVASAGSPHEAVVDNDGGEGRLTAAADSAQAGTRAGTSRSRLTAAGRAVATGQPPQQSAAEGSSSAADSVMPPRGKGRKRRSSPGGASGADDALSPTMRAMSLQGGLEKDAAGAPAAAVAAGSTHSGGIDGDHHQHQPQDGPVSPGGTARTRKLASERAYLNIDPDAADDEWAPGGDAGPTSGDSSVKAIMRCVGACASTHIAALGLWHGRSGCCMSLNRPNHLLRVVMPRTRALLDG